MTAQWSLRISCHPIPLGPSFESSRPLPSIEDSDINAYDAILHSLNCCSILWEKDLKGEKINLLYIERIYSKLLRLASEIFKPELLWQIGVDKNPCNTPCLLSQGGICDKIKKLELRNIHAKFLNSTTSQTNWNGSFQPISNYDRKIKLSHIIWLEKLIHHLLMAGTRAYRTHEELAFLLSLDDEISSLPDGTSDPFEMGLLLTSTSHGMKTLQTALRYCEDEKNFNRPPQPFYWALSRHLEKIRDRDSDSRKNRQIIISLCLDREMERALALNFNSFRVLFPVLIPLNQTDELCPCWLIAECKSEKKSPIGYSIISWNDFQSDTSFSLTHGGPLLIKLFGSPIESLPNKSDQIIGLNDKYALNADVQHRVVLDESKLLYTLKTGIPRPANATDPLDAFFTSNQFFFFGQNAIRWSDRMPYFMLSPKERSGDFSIGRSSVLGGTALSNLDIAYIDASPNDVITKFILKVAANDFK